MGIAVKCGSCGKQYVVSYEWAGKRAKCVKCGTLVGIPVPVAILEPADPIAESGGEALGAGLAATSLLDDPFGAAPDLEAASLTGGTMPCRPKRRKHNFNFSKGIAEILLAHKLSAMTAAAGLLLFFGFILTGAFITALVFAAIGLALAWMGFHSEPVQSKSKSGSSDEKWRSFWSFVGTGVMVALYYDFFHGSKFRHQELRFALLAFILFMAFVLPAVFLLGKSVIHRIGVVRILTWGYLAVFIVVAAIGLSRVLPLSSVQAVVAEPTKPFDLKSVRLPGFPDRIKPLSISSDVDMVDVQLDVPEGAPGWFNRLRIYTPTGSSLPDKFPCVLIAPAGTNLISGSHMDSELNHPERMPYVRAGFVVVAFELDGEYSSPEPSNREVVRVYKQFVASRAGLINARNALEYVLAKMPEVDHDQIYVVGHSSAGTLALLFAAHEPRIKGCVAFAPACSLRQHLGDEADAIGRLLVGGDNFLTKASPITHVANIRCPVLLFHASYDSVVPVSESIGLRNKLSQQGTRVRLITEPLDDHYESMLDPGISHAVTWLKGISGMGAVKPAETGDMKDSPKRFHPMLPGIPNIPFGPGMHRPRHPPGRPVSPPMGPTHRRR